MSGRSTGFAAKHITDRITVLRDGVAKSTFAAGALNEAEIVSAAQLGQMVQALGARPAQQVLVQATAIVLATSIRRLPVGWMWRRLAGPPRERTPTPP